jgi:hypothetical protein
MQQVLTRIDEERTTRENQIDDRLRAHLTLEREDAIGNVFAEGAQNRISILYQVVLYHHLSTIAVSSVLFQTDERLRERFFAYVTAVITYIGRHNFTEQLSQKGEPTPEDVGDEVRERVRNELLALEQMCECARKLATVLEELGIIREADGSSFMDGWTRRIPVCPRESSERMVAAHQALTELKPARLARS